MNKNTEKIDIKTSRKINEIPIRKDIKSEGYVKKLMDEALPQTLNEMGISYATTGQPLPDAQNYVNTQITSGATTFASTIATNYMLNIAKKITKQFFIAKDENNTDLYNLFLGYRDVDLDAGNAIEWLFTGPKGATLPSDAGYNDNTPTGQAQYKIKVFSNVISYDPNLDFKVEIMYQQIEPFEFFVNSTLLLDLVNTWISEMERVKMQTAYRRFADDLATLTNGAVETANGSTLLKVKPATNATNFDDAMIAAFDEFQSKKNRVRTGLVNFNRSNADKIFYTSVRAEDYVALVSRKTYSKWLANKGKIFQLQYTVGEQKMPFPQIIQVDEDFFEITTGKQSNTATPIVNDNQILFLHKNIAYKFGFAYEKKATQYFAKSDHTYMVEHVWSYKGWLDNGQGWLYENTGFSVV